MTQKDSCGYICGIYCYDGRWTLTMTPTSECVWAGTNSGYRFYHTQGTITMTKYDGSTKTAEKIDELRKIYPIFDEKLKSGSIVILDQKTAEVETQNIEQEFEKRLKKANMV